MRLLLSLVSSFSILNLNLTCIFIGASESYFARPVVLCLDVVNTLFDLAAEWDPLLLQNMNEALITHLTILLVVGETLFGKLFLLHFHSINSEP